MAHGINTHLAARALDGILDYDRLFQRNPKSIIPDYDLLLSNPNGYLKQKKVEIGPNRRIATAVFFALLLGLGTWCLGAFTLEDSGVPRPSNLLERLVRLSTLFLTVIVYLVITLRVLRGGKCLLNEQGVEFTFRGKTVFCPWALFGGPRASFQREGKANRGSIPINPSRMPLLEVWKNRGKSEGDLGIEPEKVVLARGGSVKTAQVWVGRDRDRILVRDLYQVHEEDLCELITYLGGKLGE